MTRLPTTLRTKIARIAASGLSIYDPLATHPELRLENAELQITLETALRGLDLDLPLRTRSKLVKARVCAAMGYPVPVSFKKTQPRFPGQNFDTYTQKADNLQIWNEEVSPSRRYVLIRVNDRNRVTQVRVVSGEVIAALDPTGTLTHKFQAKSRQVVSASWLVSVEDTQRVVIELATRVSSGRGTRKPIAPILPIAELYQLLLQLVGTRLPNPGNTQERGRGEVLHKAVQAAIGIKSHHDSGQFPDIPKQLLEVKLQTATTIDLGLVSPDSNAKLDVLSPFQHRDVRYAVFYASARGKSILLNHLILVTGADFFSAFRRFEGKVKNTKLQIPLPRGFFGDTE